MDGKLKIPILNQIPMARVKIVVARVFYRILHLVLRGDHHTICRKKIFYAVDLSEGIDLSIYLFGHFQNQVTRQKYFSLPGDAVILDVGANIGSMTFKFAQLAPRGHIYAFEPTDYAFRKLQHNLSLNPELGGRITAVQLFLSDKSSAGHQLKAYASWKVDGSGRRPHRLHGGDIKSADAIAAVSIDDFCSRNRIQRVDVIKIDTDGHELSVLFGARSTIEKCRPTIIFEAGLYTLEDTDENFFQYLDYFSSFKYIYLVIKKAQEN